MSPRPRYETDADLAREEAFSRIISERFKCTLQKLPIDMILDFVAIRDGVAVGFVETKIRTTPVGAYDSLLISVTKFQAADRLMKRHGLKSSLCVRWSDAWGFLDMATADRGPVSFGGRRDRGDRRDVEAVFLIPTSLFRITALPALECRSPSTAASASFRPDDPEGRASALRGSTGCR